MRRCRRQPRSGNRAVLVSLWEKLSCSVVSGRCLAAPAVRQRYAQVEKVPLELCPPVLCDETAPRAAAHSASGPKDHAKAEGRK